MQNLETLRDIENRLDMEQTEQFDAIYDLVEKARAEKKRGYGEDGNVNEMLVKFILQNGKTEYRRYFILDDVWNAAEEKLWQQSWYQKLCYPILSDDPQYAEKKLTEVNFLFVNDNYLSQLIFRGSIQKQRSIFRQIRIPMVGSLEFQRP